MRFFVVAMMVFVWTSQASVAQGVNGVGRLESPGKGSFCTGALVAPDLVLTAAHCVAQYAGEVSPVANELTFRPGKLRASPSYDAKFIVLHPLYRRALNQLQKLRFDLALVQLSEPVPETVSDSLDYGAEARHAERLFIVSWRGSKNPAPFQKSCEVQRGYPGLVTLGCEVRGGESGSPVLRQGEDGLEVVAVISSRSKLEGAPVAQASNVVIRLPALMQELARKSGQTGS